MPESNTDSPPAAATAGHSAGTGRAKAVRHSRFVIGALLVALLSTTLHLPSLQGGLITDDTVLVSDYDRRGCGPNPLDCFNNLIGHFYYRPMLPATFALGQKFHNNNPAWFHAENLVMHFLAVLAGYFAFLAIFRRRRTAFLAGSLLALHPVNVAVTSWIGGRTDTMALGLMALYALGVCNTASMIRIWRRARLPAAAYRLAGWLTVSLIALTAAVFTKEQSLGLVFLAPLLAMRNGQRQKRGQGFPWWTAVYAVPVGFFLIIALNILKQLDFDHADWSIALHVEMVGRTLFYYVSEFFLPSVADQHISTIGSWTQHEYLHAVVGYAAAVSWVVLLVRNWKNGPVRLMMLWTSISIGPVLNVVPIPNALLAPFRTAVPMFGIAGMLGAFLTPACSKAQTAAAHLNLKNIRFAAVGLLYIWYVVVTIADVPNWKTEWTYVLAEVRSDPNFVCARAAEAGEEFKQKQYGVALAHFDECITMLFGKGTPEADYPQMLRSPQMLTVMQSMSTLRYRPLEYIPQVIRERARTLQALGRYDEAILDLRAVLAVTPDDAKARSAMVDCYLAVGKPQQAEAVRKMEDVLEGKPI